MHFHTNTLRQSYKGDCHKMEKRIDAKETIDDYMENKDFTIKEVVFLCHKNVQLQIAP